jgi:hypothetical protein
MIALEPWEQEEFPAVRKQIWVLHDNGSKSLIFYMARKS